MSKPFGRLRTMSRMFSLVVSAAFAVCAVPVVAEPSPLKVLLVTGGCCHDYPEQKEILKAGLEQRVNLLVDHMHTAERNTRPALAHLKDPDYAAGYDLVIHDECAAGINDPALVENVLRPHRDGMPAVVLHCAMHSFRVVKDYGRPQAPGSPGALWFDFVGIQSSNHGPQEPIVIRFATADHPITFGLEGWTTEKEELYNNVQSPSVFPMHRSLAVGVQTFTDKENVARTAEAVVVWTNEYGPKSARVFGTSLGHANFTVADPRYLDLVARGLLWAAGKLGEDGLPVSGYGAVRR